MHPRPVGLKSDMLASSTLGCSRNLKTASKNTIGTHCDLRMIGNEVQGQGTRFIYGDAPSPQNSRRTSKRRIPKIPCMLVRNRANTNRYLPSANSIAEPIHTLKVWFVVVEKLGSEGLHMTLHDV